MTSIKNKIKYYKDGLDCFSDNMEKYKFLLDQAKKSKLFPEEFRQDNFKVEGCQAQVWLVPKFENNLIYFYSDSDAFISKGMITILTDIYSGNKPEDINSATGNHISSLTFHIELFGCCRASFTCKKDLSSWATT